MKVTASDIAAAAKEHDDMPPLLFSGNSPEGIELEVRSLLDSLKAIGRTIVYETDAAKNKLDVAITVCSQSATMLEKRPVCVVRNADFVAAEEFHKLKHLVSSYRQWWVFTAVRCSKLVIPAYCLRIICPNVAITKKKAYTKRLFNAGDMVSSGASIDEITEKFHELALSKVGQQDAATRTANLDYDLRTSTRPLLMTVLIEDAVFDLRDAVEQNRRKKVTKK